MKTKNICSGYKKVRGWVGILHKATNKGHYKCNAKALMFENGKWYCKNHAPSKIAAREEKSWQKYINRINRISN